MNTEERSRERALREEQAQARAQSTTSGADITATMTTAQAPTGGGAALPSPAAFARDAAAAVTSPASPSRRKIALALGSRDGGDTATLCAYAARKILSPDDHLTVLHVTEAPTPTWVRPSRATTTRALHACAQRWLCAARAHALGSGVFCDASFLLWRTRAHAHAPPVCARGRR
jgi:hypothetical protein